MTTYHNIPSLLDLFLDNFSKCINSLTSFLFFIAMLSLVLFSTFYYFKKQCHRKVYMLDFACFKPPTSLISTRAKTIEMCKFLSGNWDEELVDFITYGMHKTGLGDSTYLSQALVNVPPNPSMEASRNEAEMVMFGAIDELIEKTKKNAIVLKDNIGILIVNCSVFNVVPCLASMIINRYKLREDIASYNVTGMGCSAGLLAIGLAKNLLQVHPDQYALVVSTEIISEQVYSGKDRSKIATNCLFRLGGSAILLSNLPSTRKSSKYELLHNVHVNNAKSDISYNSIFLEEDPEGLIGITINKDLLVAAKSAIESNISILGRFILPVSEKSRFLINLLVRNYMASKMMPSRLRPICDNKTSGLRNRTVPERYIPKFNKCVEHFFPHVGGKPVLDELQKILGFSDSIMEASRMTLYRFGNTSSSSVWYELAYSEAKGRIKKGDRLWQMAFGAGFKCSSLVWCALRRIENEEINNNPWSGEIDQFPLNLDEIGTIDSNRYYFEPTT